MLFNGRTLIFTFSRTQVRIAEHERLQSLSKMSMASGKLLMHTAHNEALNYYITIVLYYYFN